MLEILQNGNDKMNALEKLDRVPINASCGSHLHLWAHRASKYVRSLNPWFLAVVVIPCTLAFVYLFFIASDLYMSETRFIVGAPNSQLSSIGSMLQSSAVQNIGMSSTSSAGLSPDTYAVQSFITSRDAVRDLQNGNDLRSVVARPEGDFLTRFPSIFTGKSFEALYWHYQFLVNVTVDDTSGVTTLQVLSYRPKDSQAIASALLHYSEQLVNKLNARAEEGMTSEALRQVDKAERNIATVETKFTAYRTRTQMVDPTLVSTSIYQTWSTTMTARIATATQIAELTKNSPNSPAIPGLKAQLSALDAQLAHITGQVAGNTSSVASKMGEYEQLKVDEDEAERQLASATDALVTARTDAELQHLYVEHIAEPSLPDYPLYPRRLLWFVCIVASCLVIYGVAWLLVAGIREHTDA